MMPLLISLFVYMYHSFHYYHIFSIISDQQQADVASLLVREWAGTLKSHRRGEVTKETLLGRYVFLDLLIPLFR